MPRVCAAILIALALCGSSGCDRFVENQDSSLEDIKWSVEGSETGLFEDLAGFQCNWMQPSGRFVPARLELRFDPRETVGTLERYADLVGAGYEGAPTLRLTLPAPVAQTRTYVEFPLADTTPATFAVDPLLESPPSALVLDYVNYNDQAINIAYLPLEGVKLTYERGHPLENDTGTFHEIFVHHLRIPEQTLALPNGQTWVVGGYLSDARIACDTNPFVPQE